MELLQFRMKCLPCVWSRSFWHLCGTVICLLAIILYLCICVSVILPTCPVSVPFVCIAVQGGSLWQLGIFHIGFAANFSISIVSKLLAKLNETYRNASQHPFHQVLLQFLELVFDVFSQYYWNITWHI